MIFDVPGRRQTIPAKCSKASCFLWWFHKSMCARKRSMHVFKANFLAAASRTLQTAPSSHLVSFLQLPVHQPITRRTTATRPFWSAASWPSSCSWSSSSSSSSGANMSARCWRRWAQAAPMGLKLDSQVTIVSFFTFLFIHINPLKLREWFYSNEQRFFTGCVPFFWKPLARH